MSTEPSRDDPLATAQAWLEEAESRSTRRNPLAMSLATSTPGGKPSVRMVLLRGFSADAGYFVFYTNYDSRKGAELRANSRAAGVLYWEEFGGRQLRVEGPIVRSPASESNAYFAGRPVASQLNALVSEQSRTIDDPGQLLQRSRESADELGISSDALEEPGGDRVPRPDNWGGYRLWIASLELWLEGTGRFHERHLYERELERDGERGFNAGKWHYSRLQP